MLDVIWLSKNNWKPPTELIAYEQAKLPERLEKIVRPYQREGIGWLLYLAKNHFGGVLADEMGLGKTIQTIALLAHLASDNGIWGPHLIVVPTSVMVNWEIELKKFCPGLKVMVYYGSAK